MEDPLPPNVVEPRARSWSGRIGFWAVGAVASAVVGIGLVVGLGQGDGAEEQQDLVVEDREDLAATTTAPPEDSTGTVDVPTDQSVNFIASVAATGQLESYELTLVQETTSFNMRAELVQVGSNTSSSSELAGYSSIDLLVDGRQYELDGDTWHLKPSPARLLVSATLSELTTALRELPAEEIERSASTVSLRLTCGTDDRAWVSDSVKAFCDDRVVVTATIDLETGLLVSILGEGDIEIFPGNYEEGFVEIHVVPANGLDPIEAPAQYDTTRADCIGEALGALDYVEMSELLEGNTTIENQVLFSGCGFELFPPGNDFQSTD